MDANLARKINIGIYLFHLIVGIFFLSLIHVPEFIVNALIVFLLLKKSEWAKWLLYADMILILVVLGAFPFTTELMQVTYFSGLFNTFPIPLPILIAAWCFYFCNTFFWIRRISWK